MLHLLNFFHSIHLYKLFTFLNQILYWLRLYFCISQKFMLQKFFCSWSFISINNQTLRNEIVELFRPFFRICQSLRRIIFNSLHCHPSVIFRIRWISFCQFNASDTNWPNISFVSVFISRQYFRRHPKWRSNHTILLPVGCH